MFGFLKKMNVSKLRYNTISKNIIANIYGTCIKISNQILLVPLFLHCWDKEFYADWIVLSAVSSFFTISDFGLNTVTSNDFVIKYAKGDRKECDVLLSNNYFMILLLSSMIIVATIIFLFIYDVSVVFNLKKMTRLTASIILFCFVLSIFITMFSGVVNAVYRAISKADKVFFLDNTVRLLEFFILLFGLIFYLEPIFLIILFIFPKIIVCMYKNIDAHKIFRMNINVDIYKLKKKLKPSLLFLSFPIGETVLLQGFTILINAYFGPAILIVFTTTRTLSFSVKHITNVIIASVWPELTIAYSKKNFFLMRTIYRRSLKSSILFVLLASIFLLSVGKCLFTYWTKRTVDFDFNLMFAFLLILNMNNLWNTSMVVLTSTNNHIKLSVYYVFSVIVTLILSVFMAQMHSLYLIVYSLLFVDIVMSICTIKFSLNIINPSFVKCR